MSYLALARKYRPQTFSSIAAQNFITTTLQNAISMDRVSHAYLFTGPRGVGKTSTARIFAKALNCTQSDGVNPCGKCENCLEIVDGISLDVIEIDGASNRGIDEIRSLREVIKFVPVKSKYKIYIVDEVHMLTKEAFNALLKTLEEPPEFVIFIFATTDRHKLPPTILSRCQQYEFTKIPYDEMMDNIVNILNNEKIPFEEDALNLVIRTSEGCMRDALSVLDQVIAYTDGNVDYKNTSFLLGISDKYLADEAFVAVLKEEPDKIPNIVSKIDEKGVDYKYMAECLVEHTRNMLFFAVTDTFPDKGYTATEIDFYNNLKKYASDKRLYALFQVFQKLVNDLKFYDFSRYIFEFALFKGASLSQVIPLDKVNLLQNNVNTVKDVPLVKQEKIVINKDNLVEKEEVKKDVREEEIKKSESKAETLKKLEEFISTDSLWNKVLAEIKKDAGPFGSNIDYAFLVSSNAEKITIGFPEDRSFQHAFYNKPERKAKIQEILNSFGTPAPRIEIVLENNSLGKKKVANEDVVQAESYKERQAKKIAKDDIVVKEVIDTLGGEIETIDILGNKINN